MTRIESRIDPRPELAPVYDRLFEVAPSVKAMLGCTRKLMASVESAIARLWPEQHHAVVAIPDARRGEQLVLVTERSDSPIWLAKALASPRGSRCSANSRCGSRRGL